MKNNIAKKEFEIYPNSTSSMLNISSPIQTRFSIMDEMGDEIFTETISNVVSIDISKLQTGTYFVKDHQTGKSIKFIKQ